MNALLGAGFGALAVVLAAVLPVWLTLRRSRASENAMRMDNALKAAAAAPTEHFNAVIAGWVALYGAAINQFDEQLADIRKALHACEARDAEKAIQLADLERRMGPEPDNK